MLYSATFTFPIRPEDKLRLPNLTHLQIIGLWAGAIPPHKASLYQETIPSDERDTTRDERDTTRTVA